MPDYEIIRWDENNFDIDMIQFTSEAAREKKWAFVSDYVRLYVLYNEGGIYLDTDIVVRKKFDEFLYNDFFSSVQIYPSIVKQKRTYELINEDGSLRNSIILDKGVPGIGINAAILAGKPRHPFIKDCMEFYHNKHFILEHGKQNTKVNPSIYAKIAYHYGFRYINSFQKLDNMVFYPAEVFACTRKQFTNKSHAFHFAEQSWQSHTFLQNVKRKILRTQPFMWLYLNNF
jgi:mannosyltransferase OCH1-like enzyme